MSSTISSNVLSLILLLSFSIVLSLLLSLLLSVTYESPVPGNVNVFLVVPFAVLLTLTPLVPTLYPIPFLLKFTFTPLPKLIL